MSKGALTGVILIAIGGVMLIFQKISGLIEDGREVAPICLVDLFDPSYFDWIDGWTFLSINRLLDTIVISPIYILLLIVGAIVLIIGGFFSKN